jgi:hypothetical protein
MRSAIDARLNLTDNDMVAVAWGPIHEWEAGELEADFWVKVFQGGRLVAEGASTGWKFKKPADRWDDIKCSVKQGERLQRGPAEASYGATIKMQGATEPKRQDWDAVRVELR